jgi:hypothetical protein
MERDVLILDAVRSGYHSRVKLKIYPFKLGGAAVAGTPSTGQVRIPEALLGSEWDLYRVWIEKKGGDVKMERERLNIRTAGVAVDVKERKGYSRHAVLVHPGTGTAFVGGD